MIGMLGYGKGRGCGTSGLKCRDRTAWQILRKQILKSTGKDLSISRGGSVKEVRVCLQNLSVVLDFLFNNYCLAWEPMEKNSKS